MQPELFGMAPRFDGASFSPDRDQARLSAQLASVQTLMADGRWRTLSEISHATGHPEASVSARLRDMRKSRFGSLAVESRCLQRGLWTYRVQP